ncbi:membrane protein [Anopheles sinensis]|uniref:Membrane protein n=1 Tax=Anopheles sinensis TaxID=74873 RepID=A0A084VZK3_ANOSI|nr:membrane protein [Anopheles sinensis]
MSGGAEVCSSVAVIIFCIFETTKDFNASALRRRRSNASDEPPRQEEPRKQPESHRFEGTCRKRLMVSLKVLD